MAQTHNELRKSLLGRALKDALGVDDPESMLERFGETLTPTIDLWELAEWAFLRDEVLLGDTTGQAAVPAEFSAVGLVNPTGSRYILTVDAIRVMNTGVQSCQIGYGLAATLLATLATVVCFNRDPRNVGPAFAATPGQGPASPIQFVFGSDPTIPGIITTAIESLRADPVNVMFDSMMCPFIVPPGFGLVVVGTTANTALTVNIRARARLGQIAELG